MSTHEPPRDPLRPDEGETPADRRLWRRVASPPPGPCPDPLGFAAYLDERLTAAAMTGMESHLADCAACRTAVRELRSLLADQDETAFALSPASIERAKALVPAAAQAHATAAPVVTVPRMRLRWPVVARFGMAAAASIVVCLIGFRTGTASFASDHAADADLVHEMSFGLVDADDLDDADTELALFALGLDASGKEDAP